MFKISSAWRITSEDLISLREATRVLESGGQGYFHCECVQSRKKCGTKRCKCLKADRIYAIVGAMSQKSAQISERLEFFLSLIGRWHTDSTISIFYLELDQNLFSVLIGKEFHYGKRIY